VQSLFNRTAKIKFYLKAVRQEVIEKTIRYF